jgi:hypothetical protein
MMNRGSERTVRSNDLDIKKRKARITFKLMSKLNVGVFRVQIGEERSNMVT